MPPEKERTEARLMILPPSPPSTKRRAAAWLRYQRLFRFRFMTSSQSSSPNSSAGARRMTPALLTRMSSRPRASTHSETIPAASVACGSRAGRVHRVAAPAQALDLLGGLVERHDVEGGHVGARFGQADGEALAEALAGTRHERDAAV